MYHSSYHRNVKQNKGQGHYQLLRRRRKRYRPRWRWYQCLLQKTLPLLRYQSWLNCNFVNYLREQSSKITFPTTREPTSLLLKILNPLIHSWVTPTGLCFTEALGFSWLIMKTISFTIWLRLRQLPLLKTKSRTKLQELDHKFPSLQVSRAWTTPELWSQVVSTFSAINLSTNLASATNKQSRTLFNGHSIKTAKSE